MTFDIDLRALAFAMALLDRGGRVRPCAGAAAHRCRPSGCAARRARGLGVDRGRLQRAFVVLELALSIVLVVGAELAVESVIRLRNCRSDSTPRGSPRSG